jgi:hypothetical protein
MGGKESNAVAGAAAGSLVGAVAGFSSIVESRSLLSGEETDAAADFFSVAGSSSLASGMESAGSLLKCRNKPQDNRLIVRLLEQWLDKTD